MLINRNALFDTVEYFPFAFRKLAASLQMAKMDPICLENLPNELLSHIIRFADLERLEKELLHRPSQNNTLNLMLCSSRLHTLAEPMLHDRVVLRSISSLPLFVCKLIARPEYASRLQLVYATAYSIRLDVDRLSSVDKKDLLEVINRVAPSQRQADKWSSGIQEGVWDAFVALLLAIAPNIREVKFDRWGRPDLSQHYDYPFTFEILERAAVLQRSGKSSPLALKSFHKLSLEAWCLETTYSVDLLRPFLELPSMSSVNLVGMNEISTASVPLWAIAPFSSAVKDLSLHSSLMSYDIIPPFLSIFTCVERFSYSHEYFTRGFLNFEPPYLMPALNCLQSCLKELTVIDERGDSVDKTIEYGNSAQIGHTRGSSDLAKYPIGSFSDFSKLTHICTNASIMVGDGAAGTFQGFNRSQRLVDVVPPALQSLTLKKCGESVVSNIFELVLQKETRAPHLTYLDLDWKTIRYPDGRLHRASPLIHPGFTHGQAQKLILACQKAGITLKTQTKLPPPKIVAYKVGPPELKNPQFLTAVLEYPYANYENLCKQYGCDPATGKPPGPGGYPYTHADYWSSHFYE